MKGCTTQETDDRLARTLYIRMPFTIKSAKQVQDVFLGAAQIKLTRQSSRHCHVVFSSVEEKMKNLKNIKKLVVNGKRVIACPPKINPPEEKKKKEKKIRVAKPKPEQKVTKSLFIGNIKPGTKAQEIKLAFPGCVSVVMIKSTHGKNSGAIIKMGSMQLAGEYLRKEREWPEVRGNHLTIRPDTRKRKITKKKKESSGLKIYDGDEEILSEEKLKLNKASDTSKSNESKSESSDSSEEEEEEEEEEDSKSDEDTDVEEE